MSKYFNRRLFLIGASAGIAELLVPRQALGQTPPAVGAGRTVGHRTEPAIEPPAPTGAPLSSPGHLRAVKIWDGVSGTTGRYFNYGAALPWRNKGGDWLDVAGVPQGSRSYAAASSSAPGVVSFDVSALVSLWYEVGNTGAFIFAKGGGVVVGRRENPDPALVPKLTLTFADGSSADAPCTASGITNLTTFKGVTGPTATLGTGVNMALQFALPALTHPLSKATLTLVSTKNYSGTTRLDVYELNAPKILQAVSPRPGLAANYIRDSNIDADPDVYFASTLTDPAQRDPLFPEWWIQPKSSTYVDPVDPVLGVPTLNVNYVTADFAAMTSNHRWSQKRNNIHPGVPLPTRNPKNGLQIREEIDPSQYIALQHPGTPRELYMRYYIKLKAGYQCSVEGKKLPGLAGRYGKWNSIGYYQYYAGNGGSPTRGLYAPKSGYSGWSMRALAYIGPSDANPYAEDVVLMTYAYQAQMVGPFGNNWHWGTQESGFPLLEPDRWYCIEQHVKMNTVNGPFDAYGNGTGVADGVMEAWVDGVNVLTRTDVMFRKNPAIAVDEVWLDHYHGGTHLPEAEHAFAMTALVVARRYIGPMRKRGVSPR